MHLPVNVLAYLDPGSGSMILQALLAGVAGVAVVVKLYWRRLTQALSRKPAALAESGAQTPTAPAAEKTDATDHRAA